LGVSAAIGIAAVVGSIKKGNAEIDRNIELLCSEHGGLEFAGKSDGSLKFRTSIIRVTPEDVRLEQQFEGHFGYITDSRYSEEYRFATLTFRTGDSGLVPGTYDMESSRFAMVQKVPLKAVFTDTSCADNVNAKIKGALEVAQVRASYRHQDR
jgi:hypothetical protein